VSDNQTIISIVTKSDPNFQKQVGKMTAADADHDLGIKKILDTTLVNSYNSGIPSSITKEDISDEGSTLASVFLNINGIPITNEFSLLTGFHNVVNVTDTGDVTPTMCTVGYKPDTGAGVPLFTYKVVQFTMKCEATKTYKKPGEKTVSPLPYCEKNFGKTFVTNTKLGEDRLEAAIVVDFSQHHFMEQLVEGEKYEFVIHYLMTPELVNDPAGKPNVHNQALFGKQTGGVKLKPYVQFEPSPMYYGKYDPTNPSPSNNFFSNYDFTLSPIRQVFTKKSGNNSERLITDLTINYERREGKPLTDIITDSKGENSINTVLGYLKNITDNISGRREGVEKSTAEFNFNSKVQQKRGGDWFQVLCCHDVKNRDFTELVPSGERPIGKLSTACPIYFVTHDRIAVSYALLSGVNVIYLDYYGRIFVFKNTADPTVKGSGKALEQIIFDNLKVKMDIINQRLQTANRYRNLRRQILDMFELPRFQRINNTCIGTIIPSIGSTTDGKFIANFMKFSTMALSEIFMAAVRYQFAVNSLYDISDSITFVKDNKSIFGKEYDPDQKAIISEFNRHFSVLNSIYDRFGDLVNNADEEEAMSGVENWIAANVGKLDVYKAAKGLFDGKATASDTESVFDFNRIITLQYKGAVQKSTDAYIFLPFIQTLYATGDEELIFEVTDAIKARIGDFYNKVRPAVDTRNTGFISSVANLISGRGRNGKVSPNIIFYNRLCNLVYETLLFLDQDPKTPSRDDLLFPKTELQVYKTSDAELVEKDINDIKTLNDGKISNVTEIVNSENVPREYVQPVIEAQTGGSYKYFARSNRTFNVVYDINEHQVTWKLLTANMLNDSTNLGVFLDRVKKSENIANDILELKRDFLTKYTMENIALDDVRREHERQFEPGVKRGGRSETTNKLFNASLLADTNCGYHPLLPLYLMLTSFYSTLDRKYDNNPFFYTYWTYFRVIREMTKVIEKKFDVNATAEDIIQTYCIGFALRSMFFTSHTSAVQHNTLKLFVAHKGYNTFALQNDGFANLISGSITLNKNSEKDALGLIQSRVFFNFVHDEVNIPDILEKGTSLKGMLSSSHLKILVFSLMKHIADKMKTDRNMFYVLSSKADVSISIILPKPVSNKPLSIDRPRSASRSPREKSHSHQRNSPSTKKLRKSNEPPYSRQTRRLLQQNKLLIPVPVAAGGNKRYTRRRL
jgi:hypothetical protein